jgi:hypothetical protein
LLVKRAVFLLNAAFAIAILDFISQVYDVHMGNKSYQSVAEFAYLGTDAANYEVKSLSNRNFIITSKPSEIYRECRKVWRQFFESGESV